MNAYASTSTGAARIRASETREALLLEDEIARLQESGERGVVALLGGAGSGKSTAIAHLAAVLPSGSVQLLDDPLEQQITATAPSGLVVYAAKEELTHGHLAKYQLLDWTQDELIEYLLARHRTRCTSVLARARPEDLRLLGGVPELWQPILDCLAEDAGIADARQALIRHVNMQVVSPMRPGQIQEICLRAATMPEAEWSSRLADLKLPICLVNTLRHKPVQLILGAEEIAGQLRKSRKCRFLKSKLPEELVAAAGELLAGDATGLQSLVRKVSGPAAASPRLRVCWSRPGRAGLPQGSRNRISPAHT